MESYVGQLGPTIRQLAYSQLVWADPEGDTTFARDAVERMHAQG